LRNPANMHSPMKTEHRWRPWQILEKNIIITPNFHTF